MTRLTWVLLGVGLLLHAEAKPYQEEPSEGYQYQSAKASGFAHRPHGFEAKQNLAIDEINHLQSNPFLSKPSSLQVLDHPGQSSQSHSVNVGNPFLRPSTGSAVLTTTFTDAQSRNVQNVLDCSGEGRICVARNLCVNGYASVQGLVQVRSEPQRCNVQREVCCAISQEPNEQSSITSQVRKQKNAETGLFGTSHNEQADLSSSDYSYKPPAKPFHTPNEQDRPGYLPPLGSEPSSNVPAFSRPPEDEKNVEGGASDPSQSAIPPPAPELPPQLGCAAALLCVEEKFCTLEGVISPEPVELTSNQRFRQVPMVSCRNPDNGIIGKCCRDPNYVDPWPAGNLPANYSGGFDEMGFPSFLNYAKTLAEKKKQNKAPKPSEPELAAPGEQSPSNIALQAVLVPSQPKPKNTYIPAAPSQNVPVVKPPNTYIPAAPSAPVKTYTPRPIPTFVPPRTTPKPVNTYVPPAPAPSNHYIPVAPSEQKPLVHRPSNNYIPVAPTQPKPQYQPAPKPQYQPAPQPQYQPAPKPQYQPAPQPHVPKPAPTYVPAAPTSVVPQTQRPQNTYVPVAPAPSKPKPHYQKPENTYVPAAPSEPRPIHAQVPVTPRPHVPKPASSYIPVSLPKPQVVHTPSPQVHVPSNEYLPAAHAEVKTHVHEPSKNYIPAAPTKTVHHHVPAPASNTYIPPRSSVSESRKVQLPEVFIAPHTPGAQCGLRNTVTRPSSLSQEDVAFGEIPWQAMILSTEEKKLLCSGVIIAENAVLTAAHCIEGYEAGKIAIKAGEWKLGYELKFEEPHAFEIVQVSQVVRHPEYQPGSFRSDLAILFLEHPIKLDQHVDLICLGSGPFPTAPTDRCISTGWGKVAVEVHLAGALMHGINLDVLGLDECRARVENAENQIEVDETMICAKAQQQRNNVCQVDIGGPLACDRGDGFYELVGIYSQDTGCIPTNQVATFSVIDLEWVRQMLGAQVSEPLSPPLETSGQNSLAVVQTVQQNEVPCECQKSNLPPENNQYLPPV